MLSFDSKYHLVFFVISLNGNYASGYFLTKNNIVVHLPYCFPEIEFIVGMKIFDAIKKLQEFSDSLEITLRKEIDKSDPRESFVTEYKEVLNCYPNKPFMREKHNQRLRDFCIR
jgi:hypothetical protein